MYSLCKQSLRRRHDDIKYKYKEGGELFELVEGITAKTEDVKVRKGRCTWPYEEKFSRE